MKFSVGLKNFGSSIKDVQRIGPNCLPFANVGAVLKPTVDIKWLTAAGGYFGTAASTSH